MVGGADDIEPPCHRFPEIFLEGAIGMAARHGVGVEVKERSQRQDRRTSSPMEKLSAAGA